MSELCKNNFEKAKNEGYVSRSAFKLLEIENKFNFIIKSNNILELGTGSGYNAAIISELILSGSPATIAIFFIGN